MGINFLISSLLLLATSSQGVDFATRYLDIENHGLTGRIVNGTKAPLRQFPHQLSLRRSWSSRHFCGGVLIDDYYVLTAAHCMFLDGEQIQPWTILVVGGELQLNRPTSTGQRRGVEAIFLHPQYDPETLRNDIAVLLLKVPFKITEEVKPIELPTSSPAPGTICHVAGWGYPADNIPIVSNDLMYVDIPILTKSQCQSLLVNVTDILPGMFCAGYLEGGKDACQGDSGGGMVCNGIITGIVSGGNGCALPRFPGVYSDVYYFKSWITEYSSKTQDSKYIIDDKNSATDRVNSIVITLCTLFLLSLSQL